MATVELNWRNSSITGGAKIHRCEIKARKAGDALVMEVYDMGRAVIGLYNVTAYYWSEGGQLRIPLYDDQGFRSLDDAKEALAQWYLANAPALLVTLAG